MQDATKEFLAVYAGWSFYERLNNDQKILVKRISEYLARGVEGFIEDSSNIVSPEFSADFSNRLLLHHATNQDKFKKKAFEFAFCESCRAIGKAASINADPTNPGADVTVDNVKFSLKTEASASTNRKKILISKLMEAAWVRDCLTGEDFLRHVNSRIVTHLNKYERILALRAYDLAGGFVEYSLVEIPVSLLLRMSDLKPESFSPRTAKGSSGAEVLIDGVAAFRLTLDGSVEKVTINRLLMSFCQIHATWKVPTLSSSVDEI